MTLAKCKECSGQVSKKATTCPHCGHPLRDSTTGRAAKAFLGLLMLAVGFGMLAIVYSIISVGR